MTRLSSLGLSLALFLTCALPATSLTAQTFRLNCSAADTVGQGEVVTLSFDFEDVSSRGFALPEIAGLTLVGGPNHRSQVSVVNGVRSSAETLAYRFVADQAGEILIPAVTLPTAKGALSTESVRLVVRADPEYVSVPRARPGAAPETPVPPATPATPRRWPTVKM